MPTITAIVFDTNVFGRTTDIDIPLIARWAAACQRRDAELWIPEVALWELAEHTQEIEKEHLQKLKAYNKSRQRWAREAVTAPPPLNLASITDLVEQAGAIIVPLLPDAAVTALKDQVLQTRPASKKSGVKTGAADSAWILSVFAHNGDTFENLLIVSGDTGAIHAAETTLEEPIQHVPSTRDISNLLGPATPVPQLTDDLLRATEESVDEAFGYGDWFRIMDALTSAAGADLPKDAGQQWQRQTSDGLTLGDFRVVGEPEQDPWTQAVSAQVTTQAIVDDSYARQNFWGDASEYASVSATVLLTFSVQALPDIGGDLEVVSIELDDYNIQDTSVALDS